MKPFPFFAGCVFLTSGLIAAAAPLEGEVQARQAPSCGEWIAHREKSDTLALGNASWLLGYLSGLSISAGKDFLSGTDNASLYKWMDNYCRTNPLRDVSGGGSALAAELTKKKGSPK